MAKKKMKPNKDILYNITKNNILLDKIPPGSNTDGINPKSAPLLTKSPSVKNSSGAAQKQCGYFYLRFHILCAHPAA